MNYPRLGVGTVGYHEEPPWIILALLAALRSENIHVQIFLGRGAYPRYAVARGVCGRCLRYLDSWLMTPELCREFFVRGMKTADIGIVEGVYTAEEGPESLGGLNLLARWLSLPRLVIVDASRYDPCRDLVLPAEVAGLFLDRVRDEKHFWALRTDIELLYHVPVLGGLPELPQLRSQFFQHLRLGCLPRSWWATLGQHFARWWSKDEILRLSRLKPWEGLSAADGVASSGRKIRSAVRRIALAYDEAFNRYFCETLDALEAEGAEIVDFSPLHDECLPENSDIVYIGCGDLGPHLCRLASNHCMKAALRGHLAAGRPIYGEGAGAAYLSQEIRTPRGETYTMVGLLPAIAFWQPQAPEPVPVQCTTQQESWLFPAKFPLRGYQTQEWRLSPLRPEVSLVADLPGGSPVVGCFHAVGSLVHINFAWQSQLLERFFHVSPPAKLNFDPWQASAQSP